jgi:hypothetical protein
MRLTRKKGGAWSYNYTYCEKNGKRVACKKTTKPTSKLIKIKKNGCTKTKNGKKVACTKKEHVNIFKDAWNGLFL